MKRACAISPANIAFIKFWGKKDPKINLPFNDSFSMNLSNCLTECQVDFDERLKEDEVVINGKNASENGKKRVVEIVDQVRKRAGIKVRVKVISKNNFPSDAGIASSASAFSALAMAASQAAGLLLPSKDLSILARLGSGSACRSIVDGFSHWKKGRDSESSFAVSLVPPNYWEIADVVAVVETESKKVSSGEGHSVATTSPYFSTRLKNLPGRILRMKRAILEKDFLTFGTILEEEAIDLHIIAMTSVPSIFYWNEGTVQVMNSIRFWRETGFRSFFTMDAGANVHVICKASDVKELNKRLTKLPLVLKTIVNFPSKGTRLIKNS